MPVVNPLGAGQNGHASPGVVSRKVCRHTYARCVLRAAGQNVARTRFGPPATSDGGARVSDPRAVMARVM